jgi:hypothetical protein
MTAPIKSRWQMLVWAILAAGVLGNSPAVAGPPFITDDPEPVDLGHWEVYGFSAATHVDGDTSGTLAGVEVNYGAAPNLQLHIIAPLAFDDPRGGSFQTGLGDVELGVKYRFIDPGKADWWPQVGIFPLIEVPTGDEGRGLGAGQTRAFLPVWVQKDFGKWTTYGGGGYWINPGAGNQNYWFAGWLLRRQVTDKLAIGGELFHQTADRIDGKDSSGFNIGAIYDFNDHYHLLFSAGRGIQDASAPNDFSYYVAIQHTF